MTFLVDGMLGTLAKWLRILGFDAVFRPDVEDRELILAARRTGRTLLTRDRELVRQARNITALEIRSLVLEEQVRQVLTHFGLRDAVRPFSRCPTCNAALKALTPRQAANLVPPHARETSREFALCARCGRAYWSGTHRSAMERRIAAILS